MGEKVEAKYAAEAYELFRLFERFGRSFYGLLLAQIGWLFLLLLASKIVGDKNGPPALAFPVLTFDSPYVAFQDVRLAVVAVMGSIIIGIGWVFYSRLHHYIVAPTMQILSWAIKWLSIPLFSLIVLLNAVLLPITWPLERLLLRLKMGRNKIRWIDEFHSNNPQADAEVAYKGMVDELTKKYGDKIFERLAIEEIPFTRDSLRKAAFIPLSALLERTQSYGRIGIAPLMAYSYLENFQAAKTQIQVFAVAIGKIYSVLKDISAANHMRFYDLPSHVKVRSHQEAAWVCRYFGLDVLLWGSYLDESSEMIWMNIYSRLDRDAQKEERDKMGFQFQYSIFPNTVEVDTPALVFPQKAHRQAYVVLLVAMLQALKGRAVLHKRQWASFKYLDQLYLSSDDLIDKLVLDLVTDALRVLPNEPLTSEIFPSANAQLVEIAGKWVGHQFADRFGDRDDSLWDTLGQQKVAEQLYTIAEKCSLVLPERSEHFYRLGAIACMLQDTEKAIAHFKRAGELDSHSTKVHHIGAQVKAEQELESKKNDELTLARFATHAACAINTGNEFSIRQIKEAMEISSKVGLFKLRESMPVSILVIQKMLENSLQ